MEDPMTPEDNFLTVSQFDGSAYKSSEAAELTLNTAILRAEIARSYEEFLNIFDKFYADDVEVSSADSPETVRGKDRVRPFLLKLPDCRYPSSKLRFLETPRMKRIPDGRSTSPPSVGDDAH